MADEREVSFGVGFKADTKGIDEANTKLRESQKEIEAARAKLAEIGASYQGIGSRASAAFASVKGASQSAGLAAAQSMQKAILGGQSLQKVLGAGLGSVLQSTRAKLQGFGAAAKSVFTDMGSMIRHPVQSIKASLGTALTETIQRLKDAKKGADDAGKGLKDMGDKGGSGADKLLSTLKNVAIAVAGLAVIKQAAGWVKDFMVAATGAAAKGALIYHAGVVCAAGVPPAPPSEHATYWGTLAFPNPCTNGGECICGYVRRLSRPRERRFSQEGVTPQNGDLSLQYQNHLTRQGQIRRCRRRLPFGRNDYERV